MSINLESYIPNNLPLPNLIKLTLIDYCHSNVPSIYATYLDYAFEVSTPPSISATNPQIPS